MGIRTDIVNIADVYPDGHNPREDFGDLEALAASFEINADRPGEPITPPLVVRDGNIYRIVDGERRYRAMKLANNKNFITVMVADSLDDADVMLAMLATDDKQRLTELEKSRGVQKVLLLGVTPDNAARAARIGAEDAYRVKRARDRIGDVGAQLTLETMQSIAEIEELGATDEEIAYVLSKVGSKYSYEVESAIANITRSHENAAFEEEVAELLEELGVEVVEKRPDRCGLVVCERNAGKIEKAVREAEGNLCARIESCRFSTDNPNSYVSVSFASVYSDVEQADSGGKPRPQLTPEQLAEKEAAAKRVDAYNEGRRSRAVFVGTRLTSLISDFDSSLKNTLELFYGFHKEEYPDGMDDFAELSGVEIPFRLSSYTIASCWTEFDDLREYRIEQYSSYGDEAYRSYIALLAAMEADGYTPSAEEEELAETFRAWMGTDGEEGGDDE